MTGNLTPLDHHIRQKNITIGEVIKIGLDICDELSQCYMSGVTHGEIKESNIFINEKGNYSLGNAGAAETMPPVSENINSLGMILYKLLNDQRRPFLPDAPAPFTAKDQTDAKARYLNGDRLHLPANAKKKLGDIVVKACSVAGERYTTVEDFKRDLLQFRSDITGSGYDKTVVPQDS